MMRKFLRKVLFVHCMVATLIFAPITFLYFVAKVPWVVLICDTMMVTASHDSKVLLLVDLLVYVMVTIPVLYSLQYFKRYGKAALKQNKGKAVCAMLILQLAMAVVVLVERVEIIIEG